MQMMVVMVMKKEDEEKEERGRETLEVLLIYLL